jgi:hypothetical protein
MPNLAKIKKERLKMISELVSGSIPSQKHGDVQLVLVALMHPIIKPWPFRGWGLDFIGKIHPPSSKGYCFVIVATDYFTK